jgi:uncharacterized protein (DUF169 family)
MDRARSFDEMEALLARHLRLYHHPVAIFFEPPRAGLHPVEAEPGNRLSFCQILAHVRQTGQSIRLRQNRLSCPTAADVFGLDRQEERAVKTLNKYVSLEAAEGFYQARERLLPGSRGSVALFPLEKSPAEPDAVVLVVDALQAMHLLDFYAMAKDMPEIPLSHNVNGADCANTVKAMERGGPQLALPCPDAFTSGKMERGEVVLAFPWPDFSCVTEVVAERAEKGRVSLLGGPGLVGSDVCRNCPLIKFK